MGWKRIARACVLLTALGGCAYTPETATSVWSGAAAAQDVWFATDRAQDHQDDDASGAKARFGTHWGNALICGRAGLAIPPAGGAVSRSDPARDWQDCDSEAALAAFVARLGADAATLTDWDGLPCRRLLLVVHGFNNSFFDAISRAGQVAHDTAWRCPVLAFSWSSENQVDRYAADVERSAFSVPYLIALLRALETRGLKVELLAHSMGNRVALSALSAVCARGGAAPRPVADQVILAAPDVNAEMYNDDFATFLGRAAPCAARVTVYASENDLALLASETAHGGIPRAGRRPRDDLRYLKPGQIEVVDASLAPGGNVGHGYYAQSYEMARDMMWVLDGAAPAQRATDAAPYDGGLVCEAWQGKACPDGRYVLAVAKARRPGLKFRLIRQLWPH